MSSIHLLHELTPRFFGIVADILGLIFLWNIGIAIAISLIESKMICKKK